MSHVSESGRERARRYDAFLDATHRPAHARRTAEVHAAHFLPLLAPDMRILDAGCGPGSITAGLARAVPSGSVLGIDIDPATVDRAREAAAGDGVANVRFEVANVYAIPAGASAFDAAFSHATFQHLAEPGRAADELFRVLKPGGIVALSDADYDASLIGPDDATLRRAIEVTNAVRDTAPGDARIGRKLGAILVAAGFEDVVVSASATVQGTPEATAPEAEQMARILEAPAFQERALRLDVAKSDEFAGFAAAWRAWAKAPGACWMRLWVHALGRKLG